MEKLRTVGGMAGTAISETIIDQDSSSTASCAKFPNGCVEAKPTCRIIQLTLNTTMTISDGVMVVDGLTIMTGEKNNQSESRSPWRVRSQDFANSVGDLRQVDADNQDEGNRDEGRRQHRRGQHRHRWHWGDRNIRHFNCGHWEKLDRQSSSRLISNDFCSKCWPLIAQMKRNGLYQDPRQGDEIKRTMLHENDPENSLEYTQVHDSVTRYVKPEHKLEMKIQSIEKIENPALDRRVYEVYGQLIKKNSEPLLLIHGTFGEVAEKIIQEGFKVGTHGMYGGGIYFATDTSKSVQYARDIGVKTLLLCNVVLGKYMECNAPRNDLNLQKVVADGYDSVYAKRNSKHTGGVLNDEYIVYRSEQAAPRYLVKFEVLRTV